MGRRSQSDLVSALSQLQLWLEWKFGSSWTIYIIDKNEKENLSPTPKKYLLIEKKKQAGTDLYQAQLDIS